MGFLKRLLRRGTSEQAQTTEVEAPSCPHVALTPKWDNVEDMGKDSKATSFTCTACGESFNPEEAERLRATEAERLKGDLG